MKTNRLKKTGSKAFTLIEMIGVLAVIAILAALLIPKIFEAINNARINNAALSYNTVKTALADHYAKFGSLLSSNGTPMAIGAVGALAFDKTLLNEGFLDKPFIVKIGDGVTNHVEVIAGASAATAVDAVNSSYDLDGSGVAVNDAAAGAVVQAVITGVTANDARDLNDRLDGATLGNPTLGGADLLGRVKYAAGNLTDVYIYVTHR